MIAKPDPKSCSCVASEPSASSGHIKEMKALQNSKIRKIREILRAAGFLYLNEQADALGLAVRQLGHFSRVTTNLPV
jgi:hypothetical protein